MGNARGRKRLWKPLKHRKLLSGTDTGKLFGRIIELIKPYREGNPDRGEFERPDLPRLHRLEFIVISSEGTQRDHDESLEGGPRRRSATDPRTLQELIVRKELLFPEDRRLVGSFDVIDEGENFRVIVAALS